MTAYNFGDVVLVGFPHADLRGVSGVRNSVLRGEKMVDICQEIWQKAT